MASEYMVGEVVDIAIKGVRIVSEDEHGCVTIAADGLHWLMPPQAAIERVAPVEWPPQLGDLWRDRDGDLWFASIGYDKDDAEHITLCSTRPKSLDGSGLVAVDRVLRQYGPLMLIHREDGS